MEKWNIQPIVPGEKVIRTGNATTNVPMRKINQELGFKPFRLTWIWQIDVSQAYKFTAG
jgi:hypothetical protein